VSVTPLRKRTSIVSPSTTRVTVATRPGPEAVGASVPTGEAVAVVAGAVAVAAEAGMAVPGAPDVPDVPDAAGVLKGPADEGRSVDRVGVASSLLAVVRSPVPGLAVAGVLGAFVAAVASVAFVAGETGTVEPTAARPTKRTSAA